MPPPPRERDLAGRPLPRGVPGVQRSEPDPATADAALRAAQGWLDVGRPFDAHEVCEAYWRRAPAEERPLWQALAQLGAALTQFQRGNPRGGVSLLHRAAANLAPYAGTSPHGIDVDGVRRSATAAAAAGAAPAGLRLSHP